jgi:hypothetical protein
MERKQVREVVKQINHREIREIRERDFSFADLAWFAVKAEEGRRSPRRFALVGATGFAPAFGVRRCSGALAGRGRATGGEWLQTHRRHEVRRQSEAATALSGGRAAF